MINPVDKLFNYIGDKMNPVLYNFGFTPNTLTTLSLLFAISSMYLFYIDYRIIASVFFIINYFFDVIDGQFARNYNMVTEFGDLYDHITDCSILVILLIIMYKKNSKLFIKLIPIMLILGILSLSDLGCTQLIRTEKSKSIGFTSNFCIDSIRHISSLFNTTFTNIVIMIAILFYK